MRHSIPFPGFSTIARHAVLLLAGFSTLLACDVVRGSGRLVEEEREVAAFERVVLRGEGNVEFEQSEDRELVLEAEDNLVGELVSKVERGSLILSTRQGVILDPTLPIVFHVKGPDLQRISLEGGGNFDSERLESRDLQVDIGGSGNVHLGSVESSSLSLNVSGSGEVTVDEVTAEDANVDLAGSGSVGLAGEVDSQSIDISGSGNYFGVHLESDEAAISVSGSGNVEVFARETLSVRIDGSGDVRYKGTPALDTFVSGSGSVTSLD